MTFMTSNILGAKLGAERFSCRPIFDTECAETGRRAARDLAQGSLRNLAPASKITMFAFVQ